MIEGDLMRALVAEIMTSRPSDLLYDGLLAALREEIVASRLHELKLCIQTEASPD